MIIEFETLEDDNYIITKHTCQLADIRLYTYFKRIDMLDQYIIVFKYTDLSYRVSKETYREIKDQYSRL